MSYAQLRKASREQLTLFAPTTSALGIHGTFSPNHQESIHRWYPYVEGFSHHFVGELLREFGTSGCRVHDPFAGTGTTATVAAMRGLEACYCEINPVMRLVIECKTNGLRHVARRRAELRDYLGMIANWAERHLPSPSDARGLLEHAFRGRPYFSGARLLEIIALKNALDSIHAQSPVLRDFGRLILASIAVPSSELKRAADLRYRAPHEQIPHDYSVLEAFRRKADQVVTDIQPEFADIPSVTCLGASALDDYPIRNHVDLVVTSPPYVNGTNYFRNTKVELWLAGYISSERDLGSLRDIAMCAGINDVSKRGRHPMVIAEVEEFCSTLDAVAYDKRIPELVRRYFSDSFLWIRNVHNLLKPGGTAVVDIGDSRFAGVHVPADRVLISIAERCGFKLDECRTVRPRKSKDGSALTQVLLVLRKPSDGTIARRAGGDGYREAAADFGRRLPHRDAPYSSRNWGDGLHSLCSYQGKLKPAIAHFLVSQFTEPGDTVLDPMSGSGTIPLEAFLQGRVALGNDLQELAYILTGAKVTSGHADDAIAAMDDLLQFVRNQKGEVDPTHYAEFGFNGRLPEYFNRETFAEILAARQYVTSNPCDGWGRSTVYACMLHILHGNRPYALSRRSHPVTPFKPTGPTEYRSLEPRLRDKVTRTLSIASRNGTLPGVASRLPYSTLPYDGNVDAVITSPPFVASTRFYVANWMRLWFCGWEPEDFLRRRPAFLEHQQRDSMDVYNGFFDCCRRWLKPGGKVVLHVGKTARCDMANELMRRMGDGFELVHMIDEDVAGREKFGIRDQGATVSHQYLFLRRL